MDSDTEGLLDSLIDGDVISETDGLGDGDSDGLTFSATDGEMECTDALLPVVEERALRTEGCADATPDRIEP